MINMIKQVPNIVLAGSAHACNLKQPPTPCAAAECFVAATAGMLLTHDPAPFLMQPTIREMVGVEKEEAYMASLDGMAENAFDDQCTGANPRYPLIADLKRILREAWGSPILPLSSLE